MTDASPVSPVLQASQSDELSVMEGEELQLVEDGDVDDWLKVALCSCSHCVKPDVPLENSGLCFILKLLLLLYNVKPSFPRCEETMDSAVMSWIGADYWHCTAFILPCFYFSVR